MEGKVKKRGNISISQEEGDIEVYIREFVSEKDVMNVLRSSGKSRSVDDFPVLEYCLVDCGSYPRVIDYSSISLNPQSFSEEIESIGASIVFSSENVLESYQRRIENVFYRIRKGYFIAIESHFEESTKFDLETRKKLISLGKENLVLVGSAAFYMPHKSSPLYSKELEQSLENIVKFHQIKKNENAPCVGMICKEQNFYIKDFYITKEYNLINPDLHYGTGFEEFHAKLLERFNSDSKGLVLLHGEPGTGKTYYIRTLIRDLISLGKQVIYFPPNMVGHLVSPEIMTFLSKTVIDLAEEGKSCVLLLEDAEPLLVSRNNEGRSDGITNLLNITDGLLNDMLSIQVIATFNTEMKNIDSALLRPERLIARKEFKKLKKEDAQKLLASLGVDTSCDKEMTLAEIYSERKQRDILVHEYRPDEDRKIGFR
jgi:hypothetical protein